MKLGITLRLGAAYDSITTDDGAVIDRSRLSGTERRKLARLVTGLYEKHLTNLNRTPTKHGKAR